jgi:diadenosine tetraphosphate (Ap4A) HIT family hydrolase
VSLYYFGNHRSAEQLAEMVRLEADGTCLFCPEHLAEDAEHKSVLETAHWTVTPNRYPYKGTRLHLLLIPHEHVTDMVDLSAEAREDFWLALGRVRDHYAFTYYGLGVRNGDCRFTGGTVHHLHVHLVVGDVDDPNHEPVRMKLSSRPSPGA